MEGESTASDGGRKVRERKNRLAREFKEISEKISAAASVPASGSNTGDALATPESSVHFYTPIDGGTASAGSGRSRASTNISMDPSSDPMGTEFRIDEKMTDIAYKWNILRSMSVFNERPDLISQQMKAAIMFENVAENTYLQKQGQPIEKIFWILSGSFTVQQESLFLVDNKTGNYKSIMPGQNPKEISLEPYQDLQHIPIECQKLNPGDWFPYFPDSIVNHKSLTASDIVRLGAEEKSDCSVFAEKASTVAWIHLSDLLDCSSEQIVRQLIPTQPFRFNPEFLGDELMQQHNYAEKRKNYIPSDYSTAEWCR